jgi:hypothetical protein
MFLSKDTQVVNQNAVYDTVHGVGNRILTSNDIAATGDSGAIQSYLTTGVQLGANTMANNNTPMQYTVFGTTHKATIDGIEWQYNPLTGFAMCKYTGNDVLGRELQHPMGKDLLMGWIKNLDEDFEWAVYSNFLGGTKALYLNDVTGEVTGSNIWNDTDATDTKITLGSSYLVNHNAREYMFYGWFGDDLGDGVWGIEGVSAFWKYTGDSGANELDAKIVDPELILRKAISNDGSWLLRNMQTGTRYALNTTEIEADDGTTITHDGTTVSYTGSADSYILCAFGSGAESGIDDQVVVPASTEDPLIGTMSYGFNEASGHVDINKKIDSNTSLTISGQAGRKYIYMKADGTLGFSDVEPEYKRNYYPYAGDGYVYDIDKAHMYNASGLSQPVPMAWAGSGVTIIDSTLIFTTSVSGICSTPITIQPGEQLQIKGSVLAIDSGSGLTLPYITPINTTVQTEIGAFDYIETNDLPIEVTSVTARTYPDGGTIRVDSVQRVVPRAKDPLVFIGECSVDVTGNVYDIVSYTHGS